MEQPSQPFDLPNKLRYVYLSSASIAEADDAPTLADVYKKSRESTKSVSG
tara:strand:- start:241 stop:390 length:150 start_codon:yes stop_codon:yes gene_type:complete